MDNNELTKQTANWLLARRATNPHSNDDGHAAKQWREANRPLIDRLRDLLSTIPVEVQCAGLSLQDLRIRLRGRTPGRACNHVELGAALRQLGFRRERRWHKEEDGFRAYWKLED